jgi:hypothetical protein
MWKMFVKIIPRQKHFTSVVGKNASAGEILQRTNALVPVDV